ncbi:biotin-dependent carboxyltransferase family protein [Erwiniaceae bacterium BAC15a-03b]|uniref:Biotin-dependent carboxyltransferase family protein n=1 Tax=Winslowiella arboricola TaxID=2978220 RepID=A0A9J6PSJ9_9GAMM|nr:biotin-dependent carboxyltransferase family protein [Winslowiella arboricola]MCU5772120.1 biotin-dependent carboxyltransferase family protein [Winslowiella arboricola]MCU5778544.1 biotin-dependent carboxyltransferase family protein [Winslowiella arboricola]
MIEIIKTGALNTVQDLGRSGFRHMGVSVSGVMDPLALRAGNILLGNDENAACLEIQLFPFRVRFLADTSIALTGADCRAKLDGEALPPWWGCAVKQGQELELNFPRHGARSYLCVAGGIDVPLVMGSRSTALRGSFGGHEGRWLQKGDRLPLGETQALPLPASGMGIEPPAVAMAAAFPCNADGVIQLRAIPSGEYELFAADHARFWQQQWQISNQSNRTGYRLSGEPILPSKVVEMRSYGLVPGIVQVPPAGEPIIQLSDANTAGGYPKMAGIIEEDLWRLGQVQPGQYIQLIKSDAREAISVAAEIQRWLTRLRDSCLPMKKVVGL